MHKLTITLKQHTPLIHFQHEQKGATLRASEVKPRLDRFILTQLGGDKGYEEGKKIAKGNGWLIGKGEKPALDYKMRIDAEEEPSQEYFIVSNLSIQFKRDLLREKIKVIAPSPYFAQESETQKIVSKIGVNKKEWMSLPSKGVIHDKITIGIVSMNKDIMQGITKYLSAFFSTNNFGTRQSKGFGCFYPIDEDENKFEDTLLSLNLDPIFTLKVYRTSEEDLLNHIFKTITNEYNTLKGGANREISKLMQYFEEKGILWEKEAILNFVKDKVLPKEENAFIRILLGFAKQMEYPNLNTVVEIEHLPKDPESKIERFKSPILFKVFDDNIYLLPPQSIEPKLLNQEFKFRIIQDEGRSMEDQSFILKTVSTEYYTNNFYTNFLKNYLGLKWKFL